MERASRELDRLSLELLPWPRTIVITTFLPPGMWAFLPVGWQTMTQLSLTLLRGLPPWKGDPGRDVGVSLQLARDMVRLVRGGYRGDH